MLLFTITFALHNNSVHHALHRRSGPSDTPSHHPVTVHHHHRRWSAAAALRHAAVHHRRCSAVAVHHCSCCSPSSSPLFTIASLLRCCSPHRRCSAAVRLLFTISSPLLLAIPECQPRRSATFDLFKISRTLPLIHKFRIVHNYFYTDLDAR